MNLGGTTNHLFSLLEAWNSCNNSCKCNYELEWNIDFISVDKHLKLSSRYGYLFQNRCPRTTHFCLGWKTEPELSTVISFTFLISLQDRNSKEEGQQAI